MTDLSKPMFAESSCRPPASSRGRQRRRSCTVRLGDVAAVAAREGPVGGHRLAPRLRSSFAVTVGAASGPNGCAGLRRRWRRRSARPRRTRLAALQARTSTWYVLAVGQAADGGRGAGTGGGPATAVQPVVVVLDRTAGRRRPDSTMPAVRRRPRVSTRPVTADGPAERRDRAPGRRPALAPAFCAITDDVDRVVRPPVGTNVDEEIAAAGGDLDVVEQQPVALHGLAAGVRRRRPADCRCPAGRRRRRTAAAQRRRCARDPGRHVRRAGP